jgi:hypothetical protein
MPPVTSLAEPVTDHAVPDLHTESSFGLQNGL